MANWLKKLDAKMGGTIEQIDQIAFPVRNVLNFEVFQQVDEDTAKAAELLRIRQNAAGLDYEAPDCAQKCDEQDCPELDPISGQV